MWGSWVRLDVWGLASKVLHGSTISLKRTNRNPGALTPSTVEVP